MASNLGKLVVDLLRINNMQQAHLAQNAKVHPSTISSLISGNFIPSEKTTKRIASGLGLKTNHEMTKKILEAREKDLEETQEGKYETARELRRIAAAHKIRVAHIAEALGGNAQFGSRVIQGYVMPPGKKFKGLIKFLKEHRAGDDEIRILKRAYLSDALHHDVRFEFLTDQQKQTIIDVI